MSWVGGIISPFSLEMPLCILELGKKKKKKFGFLALLVCHTKAAFGGTADCAPSAQSWFHPFLSLLYCRVPWKQHRGGAGGAQRVQRNVRAIQGSTGGLGWRAGITQVTREKLQNSSGEVWVTQRTPAGGCPSLVFTSPGTGTSGKTNAAMACPARALGNKAEHEKITLTVQIVKYPKYCIQEKLRQLNLYWKYKNTKFCYIKKTS